MALKDWIRFIGDTDWDSRADAWMSQLVSSIRSSDTDLAALNTDVDNLQSFTTGSVWSYTGAATSITATTSGTAHTLATVTLPTPPVGETHYFSLSFNCWLNWQVTSARLFTGLLQNGSGSVSKKVDFSVAGSGANRSRPYSNEFVHNVTSTSNLVVNMKMYRSVSTGGTFLALNKSLIATRIA